MALLVFARRPATLPASGVSPIEPVTRGLVCAIAPGMGTGVVDLISGLMLTKAANASLSVGGGTAGLVCSAANANASIVCPAWLKLATSITLVTRLSVLGTPTANCNLVGVTSNNTGASPFLAYSIGIEAGGAFRLGYDSGATFISYSPGSRAPVAGQPLTVAGLFATTTATMCFGPDTGSTNLVGGNPRYTATSELVLGNPAYFAGTANACIEYLLIYNRLLSQDELALLRVNPYCWLKPSMTQQWAVNTAAAPGSGERTQIVQALF